VVSDFKTAVPAPETVGRAWWLVDAEGQTLGRLASAIAQRLRGKHQPGFSPHLDIGDFVVVVNAAKVAVTGDKLAQKMYYRHSGYPGGLREEPLAEVLKRTPERAIRDAVKGMLPRTRLGRRQLGHLKVYAGPEHPHAGQAPKPMEW
jgi:large subunit ribosomal protein L13